MGPLEDIDGNVWAWLNDVAREDDRQQDNQEEDYEDRFE